MYSNEEPFHANYRGGCEKKTTETETRDDKVRMSSSHDRCNKTTSLEGTEFESVLNSRHVVNGHSNELEVNHINSKISIEFLLNNTKDCDGKADVPKKKSNKKHHHRTNTTFKVETASGSSTQSDGEKSNVCNNKKMSDEKNGSLISPTVLVKEKSCRRVSRNRKIGEKLVERQSSNCKTAKNEVIDSSCHQNSTSLTPCDESRGTNVRQCLKIATEELDRLQETCALRGEELKQLKKYLSNLRENYEHDLHCRDELLRRAEQFVDNLSKERDSYRDENKVIQNELLACKEEALNNYKKLTTANEMIEQLEKESKLINKETELLKSDNVKLQDMGRKIKRRLETAECDVEGLQSENKTLAIENNNISRDKESLQNDLNAAQVQIKTNLERIRKLQRNLETSESEVQSLSSKIISLHDENTLILKQNQEIQKNLDETLNEFALTQNENTKLINASRELRRQLHNLSMTLDEVKERAKSETSAARRELEVARDQFAKLQRQLVDPTSDAAHLRNQHRQLGDVLHTTSDAANLENKLNELMSLLQASGGETPRVDVASEHVKYSATTKLTSAIDPATSAVLTHIEDPEHLKVIKYIAALMLRERDQYWGSKIKTKNDEIHLLRNQIINARKEIKKGIFE